MPATAAKIQTTIFQALESFGADPQVIAVDATLEMLAIDSLDLAELLQILDDQYDVVLENDDLQKIETVGDVIALVVARA